METCSVCPKPHAAKGFCHAHYKKWKRYGDPFAVVKQGKGPIHTVEELFSQYMPGFPPVTISPTEGCWDWTKSTQSQGYGRFTYVGEDGKKRHMLAHRASYVIHVGPIPDGHFILHSCDRPICVQPFHLRPGTHEENMRDMVERRRHWAHK